MLIDGDTADDGRFAASASQAADLQGLIAIAVPVMLDRNRACAAIAVQAPVGRVTLDDLLAFEPDLRYTAEETAKTFLT